MAKFYNSKWYWEEQKENFDIKKHIFEITEDIPTNKETLESLLSSLAQQALLEDLPLWDARLIRQFPCEDGVARSIVIIRLHHALGDGIGLIQVLFGLLDKDPKEEAKQIETHKHHTSIWAKTLKVPTYGVYKVIKTLFTSREQNPVRTTVLSGTKKVAWTNPLDMKDVKAIKNKLQATVNDILVGCVAGAFAKIFEGVSNVNKVRAATSFNIRYSTTEIKLQNQFALLILSLPTKAGLSMKERVYIVKRKMDQKKNSVEPITNFGVQSVIVKCLPPIGVKKIVNHGR